MKRLLLTLLILPLTAQITVALESNQQDTLQVDIYLGKTYQYSEKAFLSPDNNFILSTTLTGDVYIVIRHRNHLDIVSDRPVKIDKNGFMTYNFTNGGAYNNSLAQKKIGNKWYMISGDGDKNGFIQTNDYELWRTEAGMSGYKQSDYDLNGFVQTTDKSGYWEHNVGYASQVDLWLGE